MEDDRKIFVISTGRLSQISKTYQAWMRLFSGHFRPDSYSLALEMGALYRAARSGKLDDGGV